MGVVAGVLRNVVGPVVWVLRNVLEGVVWVLRTVVRAIICIFRLNKRYRNREIKLAARRTREVKRAKQGLIGWTRTDPKRITDRGK